MPAIRRMSKTRRPSRLTNPSRPRAQKPGVSNYEEIRRRKAARLKAEKDRGLGITAGRIAAAFAGLIVALVVARENIVRLLPQTASLYARLGLHVNVRGIDFANLKTSYETQDGTRVLVVEGGIRNISSAVQPVANIRYSMRNAAGVEVYSWTGVPDRNLMPPGETTQFRTRLASPPNDGRDVRVSFQPMPRDAAALGETLIRILDGPYSACRRRGYSPRHAGARVLGRA